MSEDVVLLEGQEVMSIDGTLESKIPKADKFQVKTKNRVWTWEWGATVERG